MADLESRKLIVLEGILFLVILLASSALILAQTRDWQVAALLALVIWSAARLYYFLFYVLEKYVDPELKYAGLLALLRRLRERGRH
ncbi:MAG TPA: hypothetical protein VK348_03180 [Planctomycetota bacterium]|nr:hypothetical protein [Planctomycetota bacterium]